MKSSTKCIRIGVNVRENMAAHYELEIIRARANIKGMGRKFPGYTERQKADIQEFRMFARWTSVLCKKAEEEPTPVNPEILAEQFMRHAAEESYKYKNWPVYVFKDGLYTITGPLTDDEKKLIVCETADKDRVYFERLKSRHSGEETQEIHNNRERIPEKVRIAVWRRDSGKCNQCGSRERLEYDHIIPVAEGGSNTARNIELLCEQCNRTKGKNIQ